MRSTIGLGALVAALALSGGVAVAHDVEYENDLYYDEGEIQKNAFAFAFGGVFTDDNQKCRRFREVQLRGVTKTGPVGLVDEAATSRNGRYFMAGSLPEGSLGVDVKALRTNVGPPGHKHICPADTDFVDTVDP